MIGTNSSGARTVAYGGTKDHVLALEVVLADGSVFTRRPLRRRRRRTGRPPGRPTPWPAGPSPQVLPELRANAAAIADAMPRVVKNCSGYRLETMFGETAAGGGAAPGRRRPAPAPAGRRHRLVHLQKLFVGAEGTLGLVTEATLNLVPLPQRRGIAMAYFPSVFASGEAVPGILALGPTAVEIMDSRFLALVRRHDSRVDAMLPERTDTALLIEFEGADDAELDEKFAALEPPPGRHRRPQDGPRPDRRGDRPPLDGPQVRRGAGPAHARARAGRSPSSRTSPCIPPRCRATSTSCRSCSTGRTSTPSCTATWATATSTPGPLLDPKDPGDLRTMQRLYDEVSGYVRGIRGTMSGEHGDGLLRTPYLRQTYGDAIYSLFSLVKNAFDPQGLMNPGKKVGPQEESGTWPPGDSGPASDAVRVGGAGARPGASPPAPCSATCGTASTTTPCPRTPILHFPGAEYEREIEKCHGCAQCKSTVVTTMCPTYKATRREAASPRAKANLLRAIITGRLRPGLHLRRGRHQGRSPTTASSAACARSSARPTSTSPS